MKLRKKNAGALLALVLAFVLAAPLHAAAEAPYTYTVRIFAGAQGTINGTDCEIHTGLALGERVDFDIDSVQLDAGSKYYVRGIRLSGQDNSETLAAPSIRVTGDLDYVVAYGVRGDQVAYTVRYEDAAGNTLYPAATYYGNVGDKPVVAFRYIEGYQPQAYNLTKELTENEADNIFVFLYTPIGAGPAANPAPGGAAGTGTTGAGGTGEAAGAAPDAGQEAPAPEGESTPPRELVDLDDNATPLAPDADITDGGAPAGFAGLPLAARAGIVAGGVALLGAAAWLLVLFLRRKNKELKTMDKPERRRKKGRALPLLCNVLGTLILAVTIAACLPMVVPRLFGYSLYNVVSGSMAPEIPVGSVVYVRYVSPETIGEGEVIAFESAGGVIVHRVVQNRWVEGEFTTKGDANAEEDFGKVNYGSVIGRVEHHLPMLGGWMELFTNSIVKLYVILFADCGAMLNLLAGRLRERRAAETGQEG